MGIAKNPFRAFYKAHKGGKSECLPIGLFMTSNSNCYLASKKETTVDLKNPLHKSRCTFQKCFHTLLYLRCYSTYGIHFQIWIWFYSHYCVWIIALLLCYLMFFFIFFFLTWFCWIRCTGRTGQRLDLESSKCAAKENTMTHYESAIFDHMKMLF